MNRDSREGEPAGEHDDSPATRRRLLRWASRAALGTLVVAVAGCREAAAPSGRQSVPTPPPTVAPATPTTPAVPTATPQPTVQPSPTAQPRLVEPSWRALPRWHGFNLQEKFNVDWGVRRFDQRHFEWIAELGFNFVRLPMDYRAWAEPNNWSVLRQGVLEEIDQVVQWAERYELHVCLNFHRAPGYCVAPPYESRSLWNFRGPFGLIDSGRADVPYERWRGAQLDRAMLNLLQSFL